MLNKVLLERLYVRKKNSMQEIADALGCSVHRIQYWLKQHRIKRRSISEAIYAMHHPHGDPFVFAPPRTKEDCILFGMGIGLYWGEGTKSNKHAVRLGNTDPLLLKVFLRFLERFFRIRPNDCHFGLQIFSDLDPEEALSHWIKQLHVRPSQFYKPIVTRSGSLGTYRKKSPYGVVTIYYNNYKMRDCLVALLPAASHRKIQVRFSGSTITIGSKAAVAQR